MVAVANNEAKQVQKLRGAPDGLLLTSDQFNKLIGVGTPVRYYPVAGEPEFEDTRTRSVAWDLGNGMPVVKIEGRAGGVHVTHLELL